MQILVKVIANTKHHRVIKDNDTLKVWIDAPAVEGINNELKSKRKIIEIL